MGSPKRWIGPATFTMAWSFALAFVNQLTGLPTEVRGAITLVAIFVAVGWTALALCERPKPGAGIHIHGTAGGPSSGRIFAARLAVLAAVAALAANVGIAVIAFPSLVVQTHPPPSAFPAATQIELRPPHSDTTVSFSVVLETTSPAGDRELPCRCVNWAPPSSEGLGSCGMLEWESKRAVIAVQDLQSPARLGIWCDERVSLRVQGLKPEGVGILYGGVLDRWRRLVILFGGLIWAIASSYCWRHS